MSPSRVPALVVGLCSHGLAICRSLGRRGIPVYALESNPGLPGLKTRYAKPIFVSNINGPELIDDLVKVCRRFPEKPVLYLTNDHMVRAVAQARDEIKRCCRFNWPSGELILDLLEKKNVEKYARKAGLLYPRSVTLNGHTDLARLPADLRYPVALKPSAPLSPFKALKIEDPASLARALAHYEKTIECFVVQEWIPGTERNIYFASLYFGEDHEVVASFVGRKVRAYPEGTGAACSAEPSDRDDVLRIGLGFFDGMPIRGPVSLEIKEDDQGRSFVIEPNVGRFEFCVKTSIENGVDFPVIAYEYLTGASIDGGPRRKGRTVWVDFEKDLPRFLESLKEPAAWKAAVGFLFRRKAFAMWAIDDIKPSLWSWPRGARKYLRKTLEKLRRP